MLNSSQIPWDKFCPSFKISFGLSSTGPQKHINHPVLHTDTISQKRTSNTNLHHASVSLGLERSPQGWGNTGHQQSLMASFLCPEFLKLSVRCLTVTHYSIQGWLSSWALLQDRMPWPSKLNCSSSYQGNLHSANRLSLFLLGKERDWPFKEK